MNGSCCRQHRGHSPRSGRFGRRLRRTGWRQRRWVGRRQSRWVVHRRLGGRSGRPAGRGCRRGRKGSRQRRRGRGCGGKRGGNQASATVDARLGVLIGLAIRTCPLRHPTGIDRNGNRRRHGAGRRHGRGRGDARLLAAGALFGRSVDLHSARPIRQDVGDQEGDDQRRHHGGDHDRWSPPRAPRPEHAGPGTSGHPSPHEASSARR